MNDNDPRPFELSAPLSPAAPNEATYEGADESAEPPADAMSPAVRRLVKQYNLDVTAIRGTGPAGRVRVTDVMAVLGNRGAPPGRGDDERLPDTPRALHTAELPLTAPSSAVSPLGTHASLVAPAAAFSVFEVDLDVWLEHRERARASGNDWPLTAYFAAAAAGALTALPCSTAESAHFDVIRATETATRRTRLDQRDAASLASISIALRTREGHVANAADSADEADSAPFAVYDYAPTGCLLAAPFALERGRIAVMGVGRARRQVTIREVNGEHLPRATAHAYVALTYDTARLSLEDANGFLAKVARYRPLA